MIEEIATDLRAYLKAKGCPVPVKLGPESTDTASFGLERIVLEHGDGDRFDAPYSQQPNPRRRMTRRIGAKITIYAQSTKAGAMDFEHRVRAEHILDLVLVALSQIKSVRKGRNSFLPDGGRFLVPADLESSERLGGCTYELTFSFEHGVAEQTWAGDAMSEMTVGADTVVSRTLVGIKGGENFELACSTDDVLLTEEGHAVLTEDGQPILTESV